MKRTLAAFFVAAGFLIWSACADASTYIQAYGGAAFPHDSEARGAGSFGDMEFDQGFAAGVKIGGWWEAKPSLGLQFDFNGNFNSLDAISSAGSRAALDSDMNVYSATLNALFRLPGGFMKPYIGAGGGFYYADIGEGAISIPLLGVSAGFPDDNDGAFGWNALGGVEIELIGDKLSAFAEYRYSRADFEFDKIGLEVDYSSSQVYGGLTYTF